jgi:hypothetical protein
MFCDLCKQYDFVSLVLALRQDEEIKLPHQPSWASLCAAVELGCDFCKLCWWTVVHAYREFREDEWSEATVSEYHQRLDVENETHFTLSTARLATGFYYDRSQLNPDPEDYSEERFPDGMVGSRPHLMVCTGDREPHVKSRIVASEAPFSLCRSWLKLCTTTHAKCGEIRDQELPTRLIDVGHDKQEPRLVVTKGLKGQYVTLSHCWGDSHPPVTNSASFAAYLDRIPFQTLPRTFRDAITIVRELGLQYLWIDCFCIVQGDKADWEIECARMHRTFENSAFTIAGPGAGNTDAGILHARPTPPVHPCEILVKDEAGNFEGHITVSLTNQSVSRSDGNPIPEVGSSLEGRAWIVQERFLSSRILYFGTAQLYFECRSSELFESTFTEFQSNLTQSGPHAQISRAGFRLGQTPRADLDTWWRLVEIYSNRQLTNGSDKLPALSGIASRLQTYIDDEYLAGLWRKSLPNDLGWRTRPRQLQSAPQMSQHAAQYMAPSWSWASCDHSIEIGFRPGCDAPPQIEIHKAYTILTGLDPFGEVSYGELELSGRLKAATVWRRPTPVAADWVTSHLGELGDFVVSSSVPGSADNNGEVVAELFPDDMVGSYEVESFCKPVCCLLLKFYEAFDEDPCFVSLSREYWTALALEPVVVYGRQVFRRVGLMQSYNLAAAHPVVLQMTGKSELQDAQERDLRRRWFDDAALQTITII